MPSYYVTVTRYRSIDGVIYRGVAPLDVRHLPVRPNQKENAPPPKSCSNDLTGGWWYNDYLKFERAVHEEHKSLQWCWLGSI